MFTTKSKVKVQKSNLYDAEKGLFAKALFRKGDKVCEYAGEIKDKTDMADFYQYDQEGYMKIHRYIRDLDNERVIIGDHELVKNDWMKSGVYVNDGACLDLTIKYDHDIHQDIMSAYIDNSEMKQNVEAVTQDDKVYYIATKRIKKGEEIYAHYGKHYWLLLSGISIEQLHNF